MFAANKCLKIITRGFLDLVLKKSYDQFCVTQNCVDFDDNLLKRQKVSSGYFVTILTNRLSFLTLYIKTIIAFFVKILKYFMTLI